MALTNNEHVGKALALLKTGLEPVVERELKAKYGKFWIPSVTGPWNEEFRRRLDDGEPNLDVAVLLRMMDEEWNDTFCKILRPDHRRLISALRIYRNDWAHQHSFSSDETERVIITAALLLTALRAPEADEVSRVMSVNMIRVALQKERERQAGQRQALAAALVAQRATLAGQRADLAGLRADLAGLRAERAGLDIERERNATAERMLLTRRQALDLESNRNATAERERRLLLLRSSESLSLAQAAEREQRQALAVEHDRSATAEREQRQALAVDRERNATAEQSQRLQLLRSSNRLAQALAALDGDRKRAEGLAADLAQLRQELRDEQKRAAAAERELRELLRRSSESLAAVVAAHQQQALTAPSRRPWWRIFGR